MLDMKVSQKGIDAIKKYEGFSEKPYPCSAGKPTIGYGHTLYGKHAKLLDTDLIISEKEAEFFMIIDLKNAEQAINKYVKVSLTQEKFDALVSLVFNWGSNNFKNSNGLKKLNTGNYPAAAIEFFSKDHGVTRCGGKILKGLVKRRQEEWSMWNVE